MAVPAMSLELHERVIHAVWTGGPGAAPGGPRLGGTGVTGARQDAPAPQTPKPRNTSCVRAHRIRGFMAFRLARRAGSVMLMVPMCPVSGFRGPQGAARGGRDGRGDGDFLGRSVSRTCQNNSFESNLSKHDFRRSDRPGAG